MAVRANLVRIGNSCDIRIAKFLIEACRLGETVELSVVDGSLVIRPASAPGEGWDAAFERMLDMEHDMLLDPDIPSEFGETEWERRED